MALMAVFLTACSGSPARHGSTEAPPTVKVGSGVEDPAATTAKPPSAAAAKPTASTAAPASRLATGRLEITVSTRETGTPAHGVDVAISGPLSRVVTSDAKGIAALDVPAGRYSLRIDPVCGPEIQVQTGATGNAAVPEGETVRGTLSVAWRHRFAPGGKVTYQLAGGGTQGTGREWKVGDSYDVAFDVVDRCAAGGAGAPAPGATFPTFTFEISPAAHVTPAATAEANGHGRAVVRVTCDRAMDEIALMVTDRDAPGDTTELFDRAHFDDSPPDCVA
jgi:hypothetical protein